MCFVSKKVYLCYKTVSNMAKTATKTRPADQKPSATLNGENLHIEEVKNEASAPAPATVPAVLTPEERSKQEVAILASMASRDWIAGLKADAEALVISGIDDKAGYEAARAGKKVAKDKKIAVENKREELKAEVLLRGRAIDTEGGELRKLLKEVEDIYSNKMTAIDDAKEAIELAKEKEAANKLQARVDELCHNGMSFNGSYYRIGDTMSVDIVVLKLMEDTKYAEFLSLVKAANQSIKDAADKKAADEQAEKDRIEEQRKTNEETQRKLTLQLQKLAEQRLKIRGAMLSGIGLKFDERERSFTFVTKDHGTLVMSGSDVDQLEDDEFEAEVESLGRTVTQMKESQAQTDANAQAEADKKEAERIRKANEKAEADKRRAVRVAELMSGLGFAKITGWVGLGRVSKFPSLFDIIHVSDKEIDEFTSEEWTEKLKTLEVKVGEMIANEFAECKRLEVAAEAERVGNLSDKQKLAEWSAQARELLATLPEVKTKKFIGVRSILKSNFTTELNELDKLVCAK